MRRLKWIIISIIILIVFNVIAFVAPFQKTSTFWVAYTFGVIAIILELLVNQKVQASGKTIKSRFYGWSLVIVASVYMVVQIIFSVFFMAASDISSRIAVIVYVLSTALCLIGLVSVESSNEIIEQIDMNTERKVFYIKSLESGLRLTAISCTDPDTKKNISDLAEEIRFSDPMSTDELFSIEQKITEKCNEIDSAVKSCEYDAANEKCDQARKLLDDRNEKCKLLK